MRCFAVYHGASWIVSQQGRLQQDSHELLRCLIEGLLAEERKAIHYLQARSPTKLLGTMTLLCCIPQ